MNLIDLLIISTFPAMLLVVWFKTHAFTEYFELFKLTNLFKIKKYLEYKNNGSNMEYVDYLLVKHNSFMSRLVSCPYCLGFWLSIMTCLLFGAISLANISCVYILSLMIYFIMCKISV
jgi:hypothetical protein